jgi:hypothetical protein
VDAVEYKLFKDEGAVATETSAGGGQ